MANGAVTVSVAMEPRQHATHRAVPFRAFVVSVHDSLVQALAHCSVAADSVAHAKPAGRSLFSTLLTLQRRPAPAPIPTYGAPPPPP